MSEFKDGELSKGSAIYLATNGVCAPITTPPPIGAKGSATYDAKKRILTLRMTEEEQSMGVFAFAYDSKKRTLNIRVAILELRSSRGTEIAFQDTCWKS